MASNEPGLEQQQPCSSKPQIIYAWTMDAPSLELPDGVAFRWAHTDNMDSNRVGFVKIRTGLKALLNITVSVSPVVQWGIPGWLFKRVHLL